MSQKVERSKRLNIIRVRKHRTKKKLKLQASKELNCVRKINHDHEDVHVHMDCENFNRINFINNAGVKDNAILLEEQRRILFSSSSESESEDDNEYSDSDSINSEEFERILSKSQLASELRKWVRICQIAGTKADALLRILKKYHQELPLTAKTLLKTNLGLQKLIRKFNPEDPEDDAEFVYFGIARHLIRSVNIDLHPDQTLELQFNIDGLPIFSSSAVEFWPILGKVYHQKFAYKPFIIAVHCGKGKPKSVDKYLSEFIEELNHLLEDGLMIKDRKFSVNIMCFICDRPARAFIKCIKGHTAYYACERCQMKGDYYKNRLIFPSVNSAPRTDESFRNLDNPEHHNSISPLTAVQSLDMVRNFVLDFMHLGCLGVTKKLLNEYWLSTSSAQKLSRGDILRVSQRLMNLSSQVPVEFQRTTRSLGEISKWKATEFRFFLLYAGPLVLKNILPEQLYKHFLLLHISCRILSCEELIIQYVKHAELYLHRFVLLAQQFYGLESQVLNMHSLAHLADDVKNMQCSLSDFTAFPFENCLGQIKKSLRTGYRPLSQLCKRMEEDLMIEAEHVIEIKDFKILKHKKNNNRTQLLRLEYLECELTVKEPNNVVLLKDGTLVQIESMYSLCTDITKNNVYAIGHKLNLLEPAFNYPSSSSILNMFKVSKCEKTKKIQFILNQVKCKIVLLRVFELPSDEAETYAIPLLHSN